MIWQTPGHPVHDSSWPGQVHIKKLNLGKNNFNLV